MKIIISKHMSFYCALAIFLSSNTVNADTIEVWHGWMNLTPCSKLVTDNGFPYLKTGPQELHGYITGNIPTQQDVVDTAKNCATQGVAAATLAGILTNAAGVWPTFTSTFNSCMQGAGKEALANVLSIKTDTKCNY